MTSEGRTRSRAIKDETSGLCLWGWGPPSCPCRFGHVCWRPLGHPGKCGEREVNPMPCDRRQRPKDWDTHGREEANR